MEGNVLQTVFEALEKGCCLEIYYDGLCIIGEVHAVGWDKARNLALLLFEKSDSACEHAGGWRFVSLENARDLDVSGYFSEAPRPDYQRSDGRFERIVCAL